MESQRRPPGFFDRAGSSRGVTGAFDECASNQPHQQPACDWPQLALCSEVARLQQAARMGKFAKM